MLALPQDSDHWHGHFTHRFLRVEHGHHWERGVPPDKHLWFKVAGFLLDIEADEDDTEHEDL